MAEVPPVWACLGLGSTNVPPSHLEEWLHFHHAVGVSHVFASRNAEASHALLGVLAKAPNVTLLPPSRWPWNREVRVFGDLHARFVGQVAFLNRCVAAASAMAGEHEAFLVNLDLDEFIMPERAALASRAARFQRLPRAIAGSANSSAGGPAQCLSVRRHNFYCPDGEVGYSLSASSAASIATEKCRVFAYSMRK